MSFLQRAREKASEVAAKAADASTQERIRGGLAAAGKGAGEAARAAAETTGKVVHGAAAKASDPVTQARVKSGLAAAGKGAGDAARAAKKGARTIVERIDPGILADVIIKATALQEGTNARLRAKGSPYRIAEIQISAAIPPSVAFAIGRIDDPHDHATGEERSSQELLAAGSAGDGAIVALDRPVEEEDEESGAWDGDWDDGVAGLEDVDAADDEASDAGPDEPEDRPDAADEPAAATPTAAARSAGDPPPTA